MQFNLNRRKGEVASFGRGAGVCTVAALSLIELLIVMALLSFIVLGLLAVFNQTQRAFKAGMSQVDVLEGGRAAMDLMTREIAQISPMPLERGGAAVNFQTFEPSDYPDVPGGYAYHEQFLQTLPGGGNLSRTNFFQTMFFTVRENQQWKGIAYLVLGDNGDYLDGARDGIGSLYRFSTQLHVGDLGASASTGGLLGEFNRAYNAWRTDWLNSNMTVPPEDYGFRRILDGVIHFSVSAYVTNGYHLTPAYVYEFRTNRFARLWEGYADAGYRDQNSGGQVLWRDWRKAVPLAQARVDCRFVGNVLPTAVEIELGVVEPDVVERVSAIGPASGTYLADEVGKVHLFRQRVPIEEADIEAYKR